MKSRVETLTPPNTPNPIGPYSHIAKVGQHIWIGGTAGVDPATGQLAGADVAAQTRQILKSFVVMLEAVESDLGHERAMQDIGKDQRDDDAGDERVAMIREYFHGVNLPCERFEE